jgi:hypothetical protein
MSQGSSANIVLAQLLGRNQGPELFFTQAFTALASPYLPKNLNINRPLESLDIVFRGRVVIGTANYTSVAAEAPATIIQRIRLTGTHRKYGSLTLCDMSGATLFAFTRLFNQRSNTLLINGTRQPEPSVPYAQAGATFGNTGTYDLEIHYWLPMCPILPPSAGSQQASCTPFLLQPEDWNDTLQLQLFFGDATSFGTPAGGTTVTFTAFGSGSGSPTVTVETNYEILGPAANSGIPSAVVIRNEKNASGVVTSIGNNIRLLLLDKQKTMNCVVKSGILNTGSSGGVSVFASLSDTILDFTQIVVDNKPVRNIQNNFAGKEYYGRTFNTVLPQGYYNMSFIDSMNPLTFYRGDLVAGGASFELDSNIVSANANNSVLVTQEEVYGDPQAGTPS